MVLEATGSYEFPVTAELGVNGIPTVVVNPRQISGFAIASLVFSILAAVIFFINGFFSGNGFAWFLLLVFLVLAPTFGAVAIRQTRKDSGRKGREIAITGLCIVITEIIFILGLFFYIASHM